MNISNSLKKIQSLPKSARKIILWLIVTIVGIGLFIFWINSLKIRLKSFQKEEFIEELKIPSFGEELKIIPKIEIPEIEELKEYEE